MLLAQKLELRTPLYVDCAHGVGAPQLSKLAKELGDLLHVEIRNTPADGQLNHECGAEHVQKGRTHPAGFSRDADRYVSSPNVVVFKRGTLLCQLAFLLWTFETGQPVSIIFQVFSPLFVGFVFLIPLLITY
jgi:hypothetical protein